MNTAATAEAVADVHGDGRWMSVHQRFITEAKEREPEVLFTGDSLIQRLGETEIWEKMFVPLHCLNFGMGGDQTQHLLWRLQNGELDNIAPKVIVFCIGTNNHGHTAEQVTDGILEISKTITARQPQATVIVVSIPPRGEFTNPLREKIFAINEALAEELPNIPGVQFLNIDRSLFVSAQDGSISHKDMADYLHFTRKGYRKWVEPILDEVQVLLKNFMTADLASQGEAADVESV